MRGKNLVIGLMLSGALATSSMPAWGQSKIASPQLTPLMLIPESRIPEGKVVEIEYGVAVFSGKVVASEAAVAESGSVEIAGIVMQFGSETPLRKGTLPIDDPRAPSGAVLYCSEPRATTKQERKPVGSVNKTLRFDDAVRICLVDKDADQKFDSGFIWGAKWEQDQSASSVSPIAYQAKQNLSFPDAGNSELSITRKHRQAIPN
ncbi:hypothetical protein [Sphingorhabdus sp.]|uniref:hypothetical protein n=1 Tax=Sphingorhabdus sp. TaxID=1902408 RepID=UPI0032B77E5B